MKIGGKVSNLFKEDIINKLIKNAGVLLSGNAVAQILGLISIALTTMLLGPEKFGILVVIQTFILIVDGLLNFQSWQALIKYGTEALENKNINRFKGYIKFGTILDFSSALIGTVVGIISIQIIGPFLNLNEEHIFMATLYSLTILFHLSGTPTAILRIYGRFKLFAVQQVISATIKVIGVSIGYLLGADLWFVLIIWMVTEIVGNCLLLLFGHIILFENDIKKWWSVKIENGKEIFKFTWWTNLTSIFNLPVKQLDIIIVSLVISFEGVAIYKVFKQITQIVNQVTDPIYQAVYPQLVQLIANGKKEQSIKLVRKTGLILGIILFPAILLLSISSPLWLTWFFGEAFAAAWLVLGTFLLLRVISVCFTAVHPLFIALGLVKKNVAILIAANFVYMVLTWFLGQAIGLIGIVTAYGAQFAIVLLLKIYYIQKDMKKSY